jgi:hypothetical protein
MNDKVNFYLHIESKAYCKFSTYAVNIQLERRIYKFYCLILMVLQPRENASVFRI